MQSLKTIPMTRVPSFPTAKVPTLSTPQTIEKNVGVDQNNPHVEMAASTNALRISTHTEYDNSLEGRGVLLGGSWDLVTRVRIKVTVLTTPLNHCLRMQQSSVHARQT